jgi:hypothetical protein
LFFRHHALCGNVLAESIENVNLLRLRRVNLKGGRAGSSRFSRQAERDGPQSVVGLIAKMQDAVRRNGDGPNGVETRGRRQVTLFVVTVATRVQAIAFGLLPLLPSPFRRMPATKNKQIKSISCNSDRKLKCKKFGYTFVEVVTMMDVEIPSANVRDAHVVSAQFGGLHFPQDIRAGGVLVTDFDGGRSHSVNTLPEENEIGFYFSLSGIVLKKSNYICRR